MHVTLSRLLCLTLLTLHAAACAPPGQGAAGRGPTLAVGIASPASVEWLNDGHGRHGRPQSVLAGSPVELAAGPGGTVIALTTGPAGGGRMELEVIAPSGAATYHAAALKQAGIETSGAARLAADGQRYAVVTYQRRLEARPLAGTAAPPDGTRCALLVVDLLIREAVAAPAAAAVPCRVAERIRSLALEAVGALHGDGSQPATYAYIGLESTRYAGENGAGRLVTMELPSGVVIGSLALSGTPVDLRLAPGSRGEPAALYVLEQSGGAGGIVPMPEGGRVLVLDPLTLDVLAEHSLSAHASRLVPAPDGQSAFLVHQDTVQRLDVTTGTLRQIARLPGRIVAAEIFGDLLHLASPEARALWVLDARTGFRRADVPVAGHPISLALQVPAIRG